MIDKILNSIVDGVSWPLVFYVFLAILAVGIVVKLLRLSPVEAAKELVAEVAKITSQPVTRTGIDGALTISMILFTLIVLLVTLAQELPEILSMLKGGVETNSQSLFLLVFMICATGIAGLLSLLITRR